MKQFFESILNILKNFGTNVLEAVAVLLLGIILIKLSAKLIKSIFSKTKIEGTATSFIISIVQAALALILFFAILKIFKIDTSGAVTIVAASGLAIGLALQSSISNLAGGVILLFAKPFKEDDHVIIGNVEGKVKKIKITTIEVLTFDNVQINIPNNNVVTSNIYNLSSKQTRRIVITVPVSYKNEVNDVKAALMEIIEADERILTIPAPAVEISALKDYHIEYKVKFWTNKQDYWQINNNFNEKVLLKFKEKSLTVPFNKLYAQDNMITDKEDENV